MRKLTCIKLFFTKTLFKYRFQFYVYFKQQETAMCPIFMSQWHANKDIWQRFLHVHIFFLVFLFFSTRALWIAKKLLFGNKCQRSRRQNNTNKDKEFTWSLHFFSFTCKGICPSNHVFKELLFSTRTQP